MALDEGGGVRLADQFHVSRPWTSPWSSRTPRPGVLPVPRRCMPGLPSPLGPALPAPSQTAASPPADAIADAGVRTAPLSSNYPDSPGVDLPIQAPDNSPTLPPSEGRCTPCTYPAWTLVVAGAWAASPPATSEPAPVEAGVLPHRVARHVQLPGNLPDRTARSFQLVNLFHLSHLIAIGLMHLRRVSADDAITRRHLRCL